MFLINGDTLEINLSLAADVDVSVAYADAPIATGVVENLTRTLTAVTASGATSILATPAATKVRKIKEVAIINVDTADAPIVTVNINNGAGLFPQYRPVTLKVGDSLTYTEGVGWFPATGGLLDRKFRLAADYVNATTSFTDITGLSCPVENGKTYNFEAHLIHFANASTTGPRFGINGPTLTAIRLAMFDQVTITSVDAAVIRAGTTTTAVDTSIAGATLTGKTTDSYAIITGSFTAGANGTFAMRGQSEVAVAAGLTVRTGSWLHVWEPTG